MNTALVLSKILTSLVAIHGDMTVVVTFDPSSITGFASIPWTNCINVSNTRQLGWTGDGVGGLQVGVLSWTTGFPNGVAGDATNIGVVNMITMMEFWFDCCFCCLYFIGSIK
jgi:hypothetical protein